jgi:thymidylate synthase
MKNKIEKQYKKILYKAITEGQFRDDRTGVGSYSLFNQQLSWNLKNGFPMMTGRKIYQKVFNTEFDWFINGETNIQRFKDNNVKIWDSWANSEGDLGPVYGHQLRNFNSNGIDQLKSLLKSLKTSPDSRRHIITLWNPQQLKDMALPPCYLYFQFFVQGTKLNMFVVQRSGDLFLGIPYDIALFSKLLLYVADETNLKANKINLQIVDAHVYKNQLSVIKEYLKTKRYNLPKFTYKNKQLEIIDYQYDKKITCEVAV